MSVDERDIRAYLYAFAPRRDHLDIRVRRAMQRMPQFRWVRAITRLSLVTTACGMLAGAALLLVSRRYSTIATCIFVCCMTLHWLALMLRTHVHINVAHRMTRFWPAVLARTLEREKYDPAFITQLRTACCSGGLQSWLVLYEQPMLRRPLQVSMPWFTLLRIGPETLFLFTDKTSRAWFALLIMVFLILPFGVEVFSYAATHGELVALGFCCGVPCMVVGSLWIVLSTRRHRRRIAELLMPRAKQVCGHCDYDLRGCLPYDRSGLQVVRCPECGNEQRVGAAEPIEGPRVD